MESDAMVTLPSSDCTNLIYCAELIPMCGDSPSIGFGYAQSPGLWKFSSISILEFGLILRSCDSPVLGIDLFSGANTEETETRYHIYL